MIRSWFHEVNKAVRWFLNRIPVPFALKVELTEEVKALVEEQGKLWKQIETGLDEQTKEVKKIGDASVETKEKLEKQIVDFGKLADKARELETKTNERLDEFEVLIKSRNLGGPQEQKSVGQIVTESPLLKDYVAKGGESSGPISIGTFHKQLTTQITSGGAWIIPYRVPGVVGLPEQQLFIRDLLTTTPISTPALYYVRETLFAAESESSGKEGNAAITAETHLKPQAKFKFIPVPSVARTIATWVPASRQILADAPALQGYVNSRLLYSIFREEELQILYGDGMGDNLEGICLVAAAYNRAELGDTMIDAFRRMITQVLLARYPATGFVVNIADWERVELTKVGDTDNRYVFANPNSLLPKRIWGLPVVDTESIIEGNLLCGAFGLGAQLFLREDANIQISEHHEDFFVRNMVAIRAEERVILPIYRPQAFVYGALKVSGS